MTRYTEEDPLYIARHVIAIFGYVIRSKHLGTERDHGKALDLVKEHAYQTNRKNIVDVKYAW